VGTRSAVVEREAARVLLVDRAHRLLLFRGWDPAHPERGTWWFTPGGGLDPGETRADGACRELYEETGLRLAAEDLGEPVWRRTTEFDFDGARYRQSEVFYLVRVDGHDVITQGFSDLERRAVHEHRWWPLPELASTTDRVYPSVLAAEVARLIADGRPPLPIEIAP
jgi:8-oxo-dGTP pyrophosphatase MutT (NUDIX family)